MNMKYGKRLFAVLAAGLLLAGSLSFADANDRNGFFNGNGHMGGNWNNNENNNGNNNRNNNWNSDNDNNSWYGHMGDNWDNDNYNGYGHMYGPGNRKGGFGHMNGGGHMGSMMGGHNWNGNNWNGYQEFDEADLMDLEDLKDNVMDYLEYYDTDFEIEDIFVYSNTDYYFSVVEEETGRGAMELLVNPVTGYVYPEHGPNMMWNTKYGMHGSWNGGGFMNGIFEEYDKEDQISSDEALELANEYLAQYEEDLQAEDGGHAFYGYYTFHVELDEEAAGMMSVNVYTGDVWYHTWHGDLVEIISEGHGQED